MPDDTESNENQSAISPEQAYKQNKVEGRRQSDIADDYGISQQRVSQLVNAYEKGREKGKKAGISEVRENPGMYDLSEILDDEPDDENPYETECPSCGDTISSPGSAGSHPCPSCDTTLEWSESEV